jgi:hypothetical protein
MADMIELLQKELNQLEETKTSKARCPSRSNGWNGPGSWEESHHARLQQLSRVVNHPTVQAAIRGLKEYGYGVASVRFSAVRRIFTLIWREITAFLGTEDSILFLPAGAQ